MSWVGVRSNPDREPEWVEACPLASTVEDGWRWWEVECRVANPVHHYRFLCISDHGTQRWLNQAGWHDIEPPDHDDFRLIAYPPAPAWAATSILYQVFPDRFARTPGGPFDTARANGTLPEWAIPAEWNDPVQLAQPGRSQQLYGGDLDGVRERLDHLVSLGVNLLYLTPVFPARSNHRYDAATFDHVDPLLGGDAALIRLIDAAHVRGIRVIGDLTTNHSGDGHEWFRAAIADPAAPERSFYVLYPDGTYASWLGVSSLPKFDWASPELRRRFVDGLNSVVAKYLAPPFGFDGWRIDVANMTGRLGAVDHNREVREAVRATMCAVNEDTLLLGESTNDGAADFAGDAWHGAMTYAAFTRPVWGWLQPADTVAPGGIGFPNGAVPRLSGTQMVSAMRAMSAGYSWRVRQCTLNALDTHDTPRFATHADPAAVPVAFGLAVTLPGMPVVWAGDEFGLPGEDGEASRTPIPWDAPPSPAGDTYRALIALRSDHPVLATGGLRWLAATDDLVAYLRESATASVLVVASRAAVPSPVPLPALGPLPAPDLLVQFGEVHLTPDGPTTQGPSFAAWLLPGPPAPGW